MIDSQHLLPLPEAVLYDFLKWLVFGQGRYLGIRLAPHALPNASQIQIQALIAALCAAPRHPTDQVLGVTPLVQYDAHAMQDAVLVAEVAQYMAARQIALMRTSEDADPQQVYHLQHDALQRSIAKSKRTDHTTT